MQTDTRPNLMTMSVLDIYRLLHAFRPDAFNAHWYHYVITLPYPWYCAARAAQYHRLGTF